MHTILQSATHQLAAAGVESAALDARLLLQRALGVSREALVRDPQRRLSPQEQARYDSLIARRARREPLAKIVGTKSFWKDDFLVTPDVLDPRPDSETLIEAIINKKPDKSVAYAILDFGTGSGCLLLSLLREYPQAHGLGVDRSAAALSVARANAQALGLADRVCWVQGNWGETLQTRYDMIISNPPYIAEREIAQLAPEVKDYEPVMALSGGVDGLDAYRELLPDVARCLKPLGVAAIELGAGQAQDVAVIAESCGLSVQSVVPDVNGIDRAILLTLI